jgi:hypothetical protein
MSSLCALLVHLRLHVLQYAWEVAATLIVKEA